MTIFLNHVSLVNREQLSKFIRIHNPEVASSPCKSFIQLPLIFPVTYSNFTAKKFPSCTFTCVTHCQRVKRVSRAYRDDFFKLASLPNELILLSCTLSPRLGWTVKGGGGGAILGHPPVDWGIRWVQFSPT